MARLCGEKTRGYYDGRLLISACECGIIQRIIIF